MTKTPRSYVIDVDSSTSRYPIIFTEDTPLFAVHGTVILVNSLEHMRIPGGWIDAFGDKFTNEEMKDCIIENLDNSAVIYTPISIYKPIRTRI